MLLQDLALVIKNHVSPAIAQRFVKEYRRRCVSATKEQSQNAVTERFENSNYSAVYLKDTHELYSVAVDLQQQALQQWLQHLSQFQSFHVDLLRENLRYPHNVRILKYSPGQFIHPHSDWNYYTHASITLNLSDSYQGGDFVFFNGRYRIKLELGDALVFPADPFWVHEVEPITNGERYSLNSFIKSVPWEEGKDAELVIREKYRNSRKFIF